MPKTTTASRAPVRGDGQGLFSSLALPGPSAVATIAKDSAAGRSRPPQYKKALLDAAPSLEMFEVERGQRDFDLKKNIFVLLRGTDCFECETAESKEKGGAQRNAGRGKRQKARERYRRLPLLHAEPKRSSLKFPFRQRCVVLRSALPSHSPPTSPPAQSWGSRLRPRAFPRARLLQARRRVVGRHRGGGRSGDTFYRCRGRVTDERGVVCPLCRSATTVTVKLVKGLDEEEGSSTSSAGLGCYAIMDDLAFRNMAAEGSLSRAALLAELKPNACPAYRKLMRRVVSHYAQTLHAYEMFF
ncbi:hypothetical protein PR202_ga23443 [Eleusine coracana subsp. coracana]|uniref:Uncharacterized protein n=1 Tax=Eleusine coracana subsp. coracana TaxID=191504 RepID=A0AAV5D686_ELECO|nr:hypothetical protein PR202_ga23443 [Eleusine coracana subsp. coracana]